MATLFSDDWMQALAAAWNADETIQQDLSGTAFDARIGFGYKDQTQPAGYLEVRAGRVVHAGVYSGQPLDWDLRAESTDWKLWLTEGFGLKRLGFTTATGKLKFVAGNYRQMVGNLRLARPFLRVFELMGELETDW